MSCPKFTYFCKIRTISTALPRASNMGLISEPMHLIKVQKEGTFVSGYTNVIDYMRRFPQGTPVVYLHDDIRDLYTGTTKDDSEFLAKLVSS